MQIIKLLGAAFMLLSSISQCGTNTKDINTTNTNTTDTMINHAASVYDIKGSVTNIRKADAGNQDKLIGTILIEGSKEFDTKLDKASVSITADTTVTEQVGDKRVQASFDALKIGAKVTARFTGPVANSYPVQATASEILILDAAQQGQTTGDTTGGDSNKDKETVSPDSGEDFTGTVGLTEKVQPTLPPVLLREVRTAGQANYDRVVFEFAGETVPGYSIEYVGFV